MRSAWADDHALDGAIAQAHGLRRLGLAVGQCLQAAAHAASAL